MDLSVQTVVSLAALVVVIVLEHLTLHQNAFKHVEVKVTVVVGSVLLWAYLVGDPVYGYGCKYDTLMMITVGLVLAGLVSTIMDNLKR